MEEYKHVNKTVEIDEKKININLTTMNC